MMETAMETKKGFIKTKIGWIPNDWSYSALETVVPLNRKYGIVDGPFGSNLKRIHYKKDGIPIITSGYVTNGYFKAKDYLYVNEEKFKQEKRSAVKGGDIVMAKIGARCGASAIVPINHPTGILSGNALKISVDENRFSTIFIWSLLGFIYNSGKMELLKTVGAQPAISMSNLKKYKIPIPPLLEQQKIAKILSTWDKGIEQTQNLIEQLKLRKKGLMQQLLSGKKRLSGFSGDEEFKRLKSFINEKSKRNKDLTIKRVLSVTNSRGFINQSEQFERSVASKDLSNYKIVEKRQFAYNPSRVNVGSLDLLKNFNEGLLSPMYVIFESNELELLSDFLYYHLKSFWFKGHIPQFTQGSVRDSLSFQGLSSMQFFIPSIKEQKAIADILTSADVEIIQRVEYLESLKSQKKGLMQQLLTGKTRVTVN